MTKIYFGKTGKPPHLLQYHSLDVAAVAQALVDEHIAKLTGIELEPCRSLVGYIASLHDLGKFSWRFQDMLNGSPEKYTIRHDALGLSLSIRLKVLPRSTAEVVFGHHGAPVSLIGPNGIKIRIDKHFSESDIEAAELFCREMYEFYRPPEHDLNPVATWHLSGLITLADWLGSGFSEHLADLIPLETYWIRYAQPAAQKAIQRAQIQTPEVSQRLLTVDDPRPMQTVASQIELKNHPQLFIIEDQTGSGKTEAAFLLAHRLMASDLAEGIYWALPTMATSNAMYSRIRKVYRQLYESEPTLMLAHSRRQSVIESTNDDASDWLGDNHKKALLADVGVGTIDQALMAVLPTRHQNLRLFGLRRHVLVVDEVHSFDPYVLRLLQRLLEFHRGAGGSAILLSATLPSSIRQGLVASYGDPKGLTMDYPLLTCCDTQSEREVSTQAARERKVITTPVYENPEGIIQSLVDDGLCVAWVRNTVGEAIEAWHRLNHLNPTIFHSRFTAVDREKKERSLLADYGPGSSDPKRRGKVVIATQVLEQSLDVDFDAIISDLAPMDLLIQRAGRLQRHQRGSRPPAVLYVHMPEPIDDSGEKWFSSWSKAGMVYPSHGRLWATAKLIESRGFWKEPEDLRTMIERAYSDPAPEALAKRDSQADRQYQRDLSFARLNLLRLETGYRNVSGPSYDERYTPTRLALPTTTLRLVKGDARPWGSSWQDGDLRVNGIWTDSPQADELRNQMGSGARWVLPVIIDDQGVGTITNEQNTKMVRYSEAGLEME
jgi:CRISPR-associated endonuclease/helicase Cas3